MTEKDNINIKAKPQIAKIEQPFGVEPPLVHCPICGQATIETEDDKDFKICTHVAFIYISEISEFEYQSEDFIEKFQDINIDDNSDEDFAQNLKDAGYGYNLLVIDITFGGMACTPVWYNLKFGFDYITLLDSL